MNSGTVPPANSPPLDRIFWRTVGAVCLIKIVLLVLDHAPNFFMGDSGAFVGTALTKWFPPQRSWTYGFFIRWFSLPLQSLLPLLIFQVMASAATCALLGVCLIRYLRVSSRIAAVVMIASALDPLQLLYERMVLPETFSLTVFALVVTGCFAECRNPRILTILWLQVLFAVLISLRLQFLLPIGILVVALPFVATWPMERAAEGERWLRAWLRSALGPALAGMGALVILHGAYRAAMGIKHRQPPAYSYGTSGMLLSSLAPVLRPEDATDEALAAAIRNDAAFPLSNRALRNEQMWEPGGVMSRLEEVVGDPYRADIVERDFFRRMVRRDPVGIARTGFLNYLEYWDFSRAQFFLAIEREAGPFDSDFASILAEAFQLDVSQYPRPALTKTLHKWLVPWLGVLLASPLLLLGMLACVDRSLRRPVGLLFLVGLVMLAQNTMLSSMTCYRYLHPLTFLTFLALGVLASRAGRFMTKSDSAL